MFLDLSYRISPSLSKLMQGQSCFNLTAFGRDCSDELNSLTEADLSKA
jgi:hypothetical protein